MTFSFPRPVVAVSRCLGFAPCRYDGSQLFSAAVERLRPYVDWFDLCPELEAGLGVPRPPIRLYQGPAGIEVWQSASSRQVTHDLQEAAGRLARRLDACDGVILKNRSPSCALGDVKVYRDAFGEEVLRHDNGLFAAEVLRVMGGRTVESDEGFNDAGRWEHFCRALYVWARFRALAANPSMAKLVTFHADHKLLFLAYDQQRYRRCGALVANLNRLPLRDLLACYREELDSLLARPAKRSAMANSLQHGYGWIAGHLSGKERLLLQDAIEGYRAEQRGVREVIGLLDAQAQRLGHSYLSGQVLLHPFPVALLADLACGNRGIGQ